MHVVLPRISEKLDSLLPAALSAHHQSARTANNRVNLMLRSPPYASRIPDRLPHLPIYFWMDIEGWLGPAETRQKIEHDIVRSHNGHRKTSSLNGVRHILQDAIDTTDSDDELPLSSHPPSSKHPSSLINFSHQAIIHFLPAVLLNFPRLPLTEYSTVECSRYKLVLIALQMTELVVYVGTP